MNQILTIPRSIQKLGALLAVVSLLATSLPIGVMIAEAANEHVGQLGITESTSGDLEINDARNFVLQAQDSSGSSTTTATSLVVTLSDGGGGGVFYEGTIDGNCSAPLGGDTVTISSGDAQKAFCYSNATPDSYTITAEANNDSVAVSNTIGVNVVDTSGGPAPVITTEEFITVDGSYKGISVGFRTENFGTAVAASVTMKRTDGTTVTKHANSGVLDIINLDTAGGNQLTAPFVIEEGAFTEASDTQYWDPAPATWDANTRPTEVTITITDESGDTVVTNTTFNDGAPSWPTYESLLPPPPYIYPSTNEKNKTGTNSLQPGEVGPHVNVVNDDIPGEITLAFVNPKNYVACFEYRTDGDLSQDVGTSNPNPAVADRYPHLCVTNSTIEQTFYASDYIEVRSNFGGERNWDFNWTSFDVLPPAAPVPVCEADNTTFDTFALGSVNGQFGWQATNPSIDQRIVENTYGFSEFGCKSLRISNSYTSSSFGDHTFSYSTVDEAGEVDAEDSAFSGGTRHSLFEAEFDLATTLSTHQPGLIFSVSPDRGDGARMSWLDFTDTENGIDVRFSDVQTTSNPSAWTYTTIAEDLSRSVPHTIKFEMEFVDGPSNDIVRIYIDGALVHTGTSWENYYRYDDESNPTLINETRTVDSLLFRVAGTAVSANAGEGYLIDNVIIETSDVPPPPPLPPSEINSPAIDGVIVSGTTTLSAFYSDENGDGNDGVQWAVRSNSCSSGTVLGNVDSHSDVAVWNSEDFSYSFDTTSLPNDDYCFVFNPTEDTGDDNQRLTRLFTVDNTSTPPTVTIENPTPAESSYVRGIVTGRVIATDDEGMGSSYLRFWKGAFESGIDNLVGNCQNAPGNIGLGTHVDTSCDFNSTIHPDGTYVFSAQFLDADTQWGSAQRTFIVDNTRPVVTLDEPSAGDNVFASSTVSFKIDATDNFALNRITGNIYQNGLLYDSNSQMATGTDDTYSFSVTLPEGDYTLRYNARDEAGNIASTKTFDFSVVFTAPAIPVHVSPINNSSQNFNNFYFDWEDVDGAVSYEIQYSQNSSITGPGGSFTNVNWTGDYQGNQPTVSEARSVGASGTWYWQVRAINSANMESDWSEPWAITIDMTAPDAPSLVSPADGAVVDGASVTQTWSHVDESNVDHYVYESYHDAGAISLRWHEEITASSKTANNVADATYWWRVKAVDEAGNESDWSDLWKLTIDSSDPVTPTEPEFSTTTVVVTESTASVENQLGWLFNRDTSTQSPYAFVLGTSTVGTGSLFIEPIANNINGPSDKFIGELFLLAPISGISKISYDFNIASTSVSDADQFYVNLYTNFGTSSSTKYYDCRYDIVPTAGLMGDWTTVSINPAAGTITGGYIAHVQKNGSSPYNCPATPNEMNDLSDGSVIRAVALTAGDSAESDEGVSGYFDNVTVVQTVGSHTETTIYDFEPTTNTPTTPSNDNDNEDDEDGVTGGTFIGTTFSSGPEQRVLGVSTDDNTYAMLQAVKNRIGELLMNQYVAPTNYTPSGTANPSGEVLGESTTLAQADTSTPEEEDNLADVEIDTVVRDDEDDNQSNEEAAAWYNYLWWLLALVLLILGYILWKRRNDSNN